LIGWLVDCSRCVLCISILLTRDDSLNFTVVFTWAPFGLRIAITSIRARSNQEC
jgi:hypothetical protein